MKCVPNSIRFWKQRMLLIDNANFLNEGNNFFSAEYQQVSKVLALRHCLYWAHNLISKELRSTTAIIRFLFCVKVGRPRTSCLFFHKTGSKLKEEGQSRFCCYTISPYGIQKKKTIYSLAFFPHYYHYPGPFFLTTTTRFCDKRNCFETWYTSFIWCHKVPPLSSSPPERLFLVNREMQVQSRAEAGIICKLFPLIFFTGGMLGVI